MKKVSIVSLIVLLFVLAGCQKEKSDHEPAAKAKLLGKWQLDRLIDETWSPNGVMIDTETEMGEPGDSCIFKNNNLLHGYEDKPGGIVDEDIYPFTFLNDSTINWDDESYVIRNLTDTELYLHQEEMDTERNHKDVVKMYLVR